MEKIILLNNFIIIALKELHYLHYKELMVLYIPKYKFFIKGTVFMYGLNWKRQNIYDDGLKCFC